MNAISASDIELPEGIGDRLASFSEWTNTPLFPAEKVLVECEGGHTFSDEFLIYVQQVGMSLDWVYLNDPMPLVMRAHNAAREGRA